MEAMDIISPPRAQFSNRKRSWGDDQFERPTKRTTHTRVRDRPQCGALTQQAQNVPFELNMQPEDERMILDEPQRQRSILRLPLRHVSQPITTLFASALAMPAPQTFVTPPPALPVATDPEPNSVTLLSQTGSTTKKRFAIGPRGDCDRCKASEPGHYGHWL
ncbi:hypothetical protein BDV93DRAFT_517925 [Ceratobasidium sp. AG-I]|nr:hypothetical protein BDV93DRAFT_517925 [Ceratobasidium sp. AG-I]